MIPLSFSQPQREYLADQVAGILRREIDAGRWSTWLPGERSLASVLNVSRPTLRAALRQLVASREIDVHSRDGYSIRRRAAPAVRVEEHSLREVGVICPEHIYSMPSHIIQLVDVLRAFCAEAGLHIEIFEGRRFVRNDPQRIMPRMLGNHPKACWVAIMAGRPLQEWLVKTASPAVIYGNAYADIELPSVGVDYRGCVRHAAAWLLGRGHRRIALVAYDSRRAGDQESIAGFQQAFETHPGDGCRPIIVSRPDDDVAALCQQVDRLMRSGQRPTAFIVCRSHHYATVATHLTERGWRIPGQVSLVCRGDDTFLHFLCPAPAHYRVNMELQGRTLFRCMQRVIGGARLPSERHQLVPEFVPGDSVGPVAMARTSGT